MAASAAASAAGKPSAAASNAAAAASAAAASGGASMEEVMKGEGMEGTAAAEEMEKLDRAALERFVYPQRLFFIPLRRTRRVLCSSKPRAGPMHSQVRSAGERHRFGKMSVVFSFVPDFE